MMNLLQALLDQRRRPATGGQGAPLPGIAYPTTDAADRLGQLTTVKR